MPTFQSNLDFVWVIFIPFGLMYNNNPLLLNAELKRKLIIK